MDAKLKAFLSGRSALATEAASWGALDLEIRYYLSDELPPEHLITSVRALVLSDGHVLVVREPSGKEHIVPGGRRMAHESLEQALRRELLEETRWTVTVISLLGVAHFHVTSPVPKDYPYPHPDFLQLIYLAAPEKLRPELEITDDWVESCEMVPIEAVLESGIPQTQRRLLQYAIGRSVL